MMTNKFWNWPVYLFGNKIDDKVNSMKNQSVEPTQKAGEMHISCKNDW